MAEFIENLHCFIKPSLPFMEMDPSLELMGQFAELSGTAMENSGVGLMGFSGENFLSHQQPEFSMPPFADNLSSFLPLESARPMTPCSRPVTSNEENIPGDRKRKAKAAPETSSANSSEPPTESCPIDDKSDQKKNVYMFVFLLFLFRLLILCRRGIKALKSTLSSFALHFAFQGPGSAKRGRRNSKEVGKPKEVVHVRARRGQATDSHSLAERVRREKINERMRYLQGLVPGCYKAMGMAGMLDEIINYVQSLQNQVEFLSMKLSAASSFHDYCLDLEAMATPQVGNPFEAQDVERARREGFGGCASCFHSTMPF